MSLSVLRADLILQIWLLHLRGYEGKELWVQGREERGGGEGEGRVLRIVRTVTFVSIFVFQLPHMFPNWNLVLKSMFFMLIFH